MVALAVEPESQQLYALQQGREGLYELWPRLYSREHDARLPAEEVLAIRPGDDFGWPYCYFDPFAGKRVLAPEYGGDGIASEGCETYRPPANWLPAHSSPTDILFYSGHQFPELYRRGAFVALHGGVNAAGVAQSGYSLQFIPRDRDGQFGPAVTFARGFVDEPVLNPSSARHRPIGLAESPDGTLFLSDDKHGALWRITYIEP